MACNNVPFVLAYRFCNWHLGLLLGMFRALSLLRGHGRAPHSTILIRWALGACYACQKNTTTVYGLVPMGLVAGFIHVTHMKQCCNTHLTLYSVHIATPYWCSVHGFTVSSPPRSSEQYPMTPRILWSPPRITEQWHHNVVHPPVSHTTTKAIFHCYLGMSPCHLPNHLLGAQVGLGWHACNHTTTNK